MNLPYHHVVLWRFAGYLMHTHEKPEFQNNFILVIPYYCNWVTFFLLKDRVSMYWEINPKMYHTNNIIMYEVQKVLEKVFYLFHLYSINSDM